MAAYESEKEPSSSSSSSTSSPKTTPQSPLFLPEIPQRSFAPNIPSASPFLSPAISPAPEITKKNPTPPSSTSSSSSPSPKIVPPLYPSPANKTLVVLPPPPNRNPSVSPRPRSRSSSDPSRSSSPGDIFVCTDGIIDEKLFSQYELTLSALIKEAKSLKDSEESLFTQTIQNVENFINTRNYTSLRTALNSCRSYFNTSVFTRVFTGQKTIKENIIKEIKDILLSIIEPDDNFCLVNSRTPTSTTPAPVTEDVCVIVSRRQPRKLLEAKRTQEENDKKFDKRVNVFYKLYSGKFNLFDLRDFPQLLASATSDIACFSVRPSLLPDYHHLFTQTTNFKKFGILEQIKLVAYAYLSIKLFFPPSDNFDNLMKGLPHWLKLIKKRARLVKSLEEDDVSTPEEIAAIRNMLGIDFIKKFALLPEEICNVLLDEQEMSAWKATWAEDKKTTQIKQQRERSKTF